MDKKSLQSPSKRQKKTVQPQKGRISLNLDPGFRWIGFSVFEMGVVDTVLEMGLIRTEKSDKKLRVRDADDNQRCTREIAKELIGIIQKYSPSVICMESQSSVRNSSASAKVGLTYGCIITLAEVYNIPLIGSTPQEIKKCTCGKRNASKTEIMDAVKIRFPEEVNVRAFQEFEEVWEKNESNHNHAWDSLAAFIAAQASEVMKALRV